jgi:hypothetical protein
VAADFHEAAVGSEVLALIADFVAAQGIEDAGVVGQLFDGEGGGGGVVVGRVLAIELVVEGGGFNGPDAEETPAGGGHGFDQRFFEGGLRLEFSGEVSDELEEAGLVLDLESQGVAEDAVTGGVVGGGAFALGRNRSAGFDAVGTGRLALLVGSHDRGFITRGKCHSEKCGEFL